MLRIRIYHAGCRVQQQYSLRCPESIHQFSSGNDCLCNLPQCRPNAPNSRIQRGHRSISNQNWSKRNGRQQLADCLCLYLQHRLLLPLTSRKTFPIRRYFRLAGYRPCMLSSSLTFAWLLRLSVSSLDGSRSHLCHSMREYSDPQAFRIQS